MSFVEDYFEPRTDVLGMLGEHGKQEVRWENAHLAAHLLGVLRDLCTRKQGDEVIIGMMFKGETVVRKYEVTERREGCSLACPATMRWVRYTDVALCEAGSHCDQGFSIRLYADGFIVRLKPGCVVAYDCAQFITSPGSNMDTFALFL